MPDAPITASRIPAKPAWLRAWVASCRGVARFDLHEIRAAHRALAPTARATQLRYPPATLLRCTCGARGCVDYMVVCGLNERHDGTATVLVQGAPGGERWELREGDAEVVAYGSGLTPRLFEVLVATPVLGEA